MIISDQLHDNQQENDFSLRRDDEKDWFIKSSCVIKQQELWYMKDGTLFSRRN